MEPLSVIKLLSLSKHIAEFSGIIEGIEGKIDKLSNAELDAGISNLKQATNSEGEKIHLLREARNHFNKSVFLENNKRKLFSLTGLCLCHQYLGDNSNAKSTYEEIRNLSFEINSLDSHLISLKKFTEKETNDLKTNLWKLVLIGPSPFLVANAMIGLRTDYKKKELEDFNISKQKSIELIENIMANTLK